MRLVVIRIENTDSRRGGGGQIHSRRILARADASTRRASCADAVDSDRSYHITHRASCRVWTLKALKSTNLPTLN